MICQVHKNVYACLLEQWILKLKRFENGFILLNSVVIKPTIFLSVNLVLKDKKTSMFSKILINMKAYYILISYFDSYSEHNFIIFQDIQLFDFSMWLTWGRYRNTYRRLMKQ